MLAPEEQEVLVEYDPSLEVVITPELDEADGFF